MSTEKKEKQLAEELPNARNFQTFRNFIKTLIKGCVKSKDFSSLYPHLPKFISHYEELFERFEALFLKINKLEGSDDFLIIQNPEFQMSYIDKLPLFDGSDDKIEVFVIERYVNHKLVRKECYPVSELQNQTQELPEAPIPDSAQLGDLIPEVVPEQIDINDYAESI